MQDYDGNFTIKMKCFAFKVGDWSSFKESLVTCEFVSVDYEVQGSLNTLLALV